MFPDPASLYREIRVSFAPNFHHIDPANGMRPALFLLITMLVATTLGGCASVTKPTDETAKWSAEKLYREATNSLHQNDFEIAAGYLEKLEARYPFGKYAAQAQLESAYAYYRAGEPTLAIAAAERFIRLHPTHPFVDYAYYLKGLVSFNIKHGSLDWLIGEKDYSDRDPQSMRDALEAFQELVRRFPGSRYAPDASLRITYLHNLMAKSEINVARHYYARKAYVATVNRCKYVLDHYQATPAAEDALGLQSMAYLRMGMAKLAEDSARVLKLNFPKSKYLKQVQAMLSASKKPRSGAKG
jgi:outer membrane protein assembly factor BamD